MARSPSYAGFWALLREALRRKPKGYRLHNLSLRCLNRPVRLESESWMLSRVVYVGEFQSRGLIHASLDPKKRIDDARRRRDLVGRIDRHFHALGYRPRTTLRYEKAIDGHGDDVKFWLRFLNAVEVDSGRKASRSLPAALRSHLREGWEITGVSMHGPPKRIRAGLPWILIPYVFWEIREGISLTVDLSPAKRVIWSEYQKNAAAVRFLADVEQQLKSRGLRNPLGTVSKQSMHRGRFLGMVFDRRRIIPAQLGPTLDGLRDWNPTESAGRPA